MIQKVVFIMAIFPRSGTNFLRDILEKHPDCEFGHVGGEDFLLYNIDKLEVFLKNVNNRWRSDWGNSIDELTEELVEGFYRFITKGCDQSKPYIICKTPFSRNIGKFGKYFGNSKLIIILRDGRDVVDSYINTFNPNFIRATRLWAKHGLELSDFLNSKKFEDFHVLKYENLISQPEIEIKNMLEYLELNIDIFPFSSIKEMNVKGSSQIKTIAQVEKVKMEVKKSTNMQFTGRYQKWSWIRKTIFENIAGSVNRELGYK